MHPPILRCLVPGAQRATGPLAEPGEIAPVPALLAIETLVAYLRSVDPRRENDHTWAGFVADNQIASPEFLARCRTALTAGRKAARRGRAALGFVATSLVCDTARFSTRTPPGQLRLRL